MSTPMVDPLQIQPPPMAMIQQANTANSGRGSIGPVIAVLVVITILGLVSGMIGRLCSGRRLMGRGRYDLEGWVERKFSSCIDGRVDPPLPLAVAENTGGGGGGSGGGDAVPVAAPVETPQETKEEEITQQRPNESARAPS